MRAPLTLLVLVVLALSGLGWAGCAGGQSGTECNTGESNRDVNPFNTETTDEDAGVEDDIDGGNNEFVGTEEAGDAKQCILPEEGTREY